MASVSHVVVMEPQELGQQDTHQILVVLSGKGNTGELMNNSLGFIMRRVDNVFLVLSQLKYAITDGFTCFLFTFMSWLSEI